MLLHNLNTIDYNNNNTNKNDCTSKEKYIELLNNNREILKSRFGSILTNGVGGLNPKKLAYRFKNKKCLQLKQL